MRSSSDLRRPWLACCGLAILSLALYAPAVSFGFVNYDDTTILLSHPQLYDEHSLWASLAQIFVGYLPREEPLLVRDVSWALDARWFGFQNPAGYHLGNVVLNAANAVLLFLFLHQATRRFGLALATAGVFAVLPVHVEPVAWVMGRKDVLSACFLLAALLAQSHELAAPDPARRRQLHLATILLLALALLSKIAAMGGFALLLLHRVFAPYLDGRREPSAPLDWPRIVREVLPRMAPHAIVTAGVVLWYQRNLAAFGVIGWRGPGPLDPEHLGTVAAFTPLIIGGYLRSLLWPTQLSMAYRWPHVEIPLGGFEQLASVAIALGVGAGLAHCLLRRRDLAFYGLGFLALLLPYLNVVFVDIWRADRYVYLSAFCLLAIPATIVAARPRGAVRIVALALAACFAAGSLVQTRRQLWVWRDNESLWTHEAYMAEPSLIGIQGLAAAYVKRSERESDRAARGEWIRRARVEIERGFARDRALGRQPSGYVTSEPLQLSHLHHHLAYLAGLEGAPLEEQIAHEVRAHETAPNARSAYHLAEAYLALARQKPPPAQEALARTSLGFFLEYMRRTAADPARLEKNSRMLASVYERRFPFLGEEIRVARANGFQ